MALTDEELSGFNVQAKPVVDIPKLDRVQANSGLSQEEIDGFGATEDTDSIARENLNLNYGQDADKAAERQLRARELGLPRSTSINDETLDKALKQKQKADFDKKLSDGTMGDATSKHFQKPENAAISHDDYDNLSNLERLIRDNYKKNLLHKSYDVGKAFVEGVQEKGLAEFGSALKDRALVDAGYSHLIGTFGTMRAQSEIGEQTSSLFGINIKDLQRNQMEFMASLFGDDKEKAAEWYDNITADSSGLSSGLYKNLGEGYQAKSDQLKQTTDYKSPEVNAFLEAAGSAGSSTMATIPSIITNKNPLTLLGFGNMVFGQSYSEGRDKYGLSVGDSFMRASIQAGSEVGSEFLSLPLWDKIFKGGAGAESLIKLTAGESATESLSTVGSNYADWLILPENEDKSFTDFLSEQPSDIYETIKTTLLTTPMQLVFGKSISVPANYVRDTLDNRTLKKNKEAVTKIIQGENDQKVIDEIIKFGQPSLTAARDPEVFEEFIKSIDESGEINLYVPADIAQTMADLPEYLAVQLDGMGGDVEIPISKFMRDIVPNPEMLNAMRPHLKKNPDLPSLAEIKANGDTAIKTMLDEAKRVIQEKDDIDTGYENIKQQLIDTGVVQSGEADANAVLVKEYVQRVSKERNMTIPEAYDYLKLKIAKPEESIDAQDVIDQDPLVSAKSQGYEGEDIGESKEWVAATKKFGKEGMTKEARMARAKEAGFDVDNVYYHGSTHVVREGFDASGSNIESDWGKGIYVTNSPDDASINYAGEGADLTQRIEIAAERKVDEIQDLIDEQGEDAAKEMYGEENYNEDTMEFARNVVKAQGLKGETEGVVYPLLINKEKFAVLGGDNPTVFEGEDLSAQARDEIARDDYDSDDDYEDAVSDRIYELEEEEGVVGKISQALENAISEYGGDSSLVMERLDFSDNRITIEDLDAAIRSAELYLEDNEGNMVSAGAVSAMVLKELGYEGVIDKTVDTKFGSQRRVGQQMEGMDYDTEHVIVFPDSEKSIRSISAAFDPDYKDSPNLLHQFAGHRSITAPRGQLVKAMEMLDKGKNEELIRQETGWHRGADGLWRYEISDDKADFVPAFKESNDTLTPHMSAGKNFEALQKSLGKKTIYLDDILSHEKLFEAYPRLKDLRVEFADIGGEYFGTYSERTRTITISNDINNEQALSTMLHEVQHAIQKIEYFATGGNMDKDFTDSLKDGVARLLEKTNAELLKWENNKGYKLKAVEESGRQLDNVVKYKSIQALQKYSRHDKPSGLLRHIRNEVQWFYGAEFRDNEAARELQRRWYAMPKKHKRAELQEFLRQMSFDAAKVLRDSIPKEQLERFEKDERKVDSIINAMRKEYRKFRDDIQPHVDLKRKRANLARYENAVKYKTPYDIYRSLLGEVEARMTQERQKLTDDERTNTALSNAGVNPDEVIVIMGSMELRAPIAMMSGEAEPQEFFQPDITLQQQDNKVAYNHEEQKLNTRIRQWASAFNLNEGRALGIVEREWEEPSSYKVERSTKNAFISDEDYQTTPEEGKLEQEKLIAAAKENGFFFDKNHPLFKAITVNKIKGGMEHDAYIIQADDGDVVIRSTNHIGFGHANKHSPANYLKRFQDYNSLYPHLQVRVIGVSQRDDGTAVIWTAQNFVEGKEYTTEEELDSSMRKAGWFVTGVNKKGLPKRYQHKDTKAIIGDVHVGNILHIGDDLYPIDIIVEKMPEQSTKTFQQSGNITTPEQLADKLNPSKERETSLLQKKLNQIEALSNCLKKG